MRMATAWARSLTTGPDLLPEWRAPRLYLPMTSLLGMAGSVGEGGVDPVDLEPGVVLVFPGGEAGIGHAVGYHRLPFGGVALGQLGEVLGREGHYASMRKGRDQRVRVPTRSRPHPSESVGVSMLLPLGVVSQGPTFIHGFPVRCGIGNPQPVRELACEAPVDDGTLGRTATVVGEVVDILHR